jgi:uncharacterized protein
VRRILTDATLAGGSALLSRLVGLPRPVTRDVEVRRGIAVRARDGVGLRTDHYAPAIVDAPTVLVRTPYGRTGPPAVAARAMAEQGFHVVVSSCRGTFGSGGLFDPMRYERDDGLDTVDWLRRQSWFTGVLGTFGVSYVGYTQWAIADVPELAAMATVVTASQLRGPTYSGESFSLYTTLAWASLIQSQGKPRLAGTIELLRGQPQLKRALTHLPLGEADRVATGVEVAFFRSWLNHATIDDGGPLASAADAYWGELGHEHRLAGVAAPVLMVGGWHDIFLPWQLRDYSALRAAGARPYLTIGPWTHGSLGLFAGSLRESVLWLRAQLRDEKEFLRERPVRIHVAGAGWRDLDDWPPATSRATSWFLHGGGRLTSAAPPDAGTAYAVPDRFTYDPADPTPSVGGPLLVANVAGPRDNRALEARPDVITFTGARCDTAVEFVGPVTATVYVRASRPHFDLFVRLCDVDPSGRSINICDGIRRVAPGRFATDGDGVQAVTVELWPTAYRFAAGHRVRAQVSGGAYPRYARSLGTGEPLTTAVSGQPVDIEIFHDADRPSAVHLPAVTGNG